MPGTVDDFMQRFGGGGTMDESEAAQYHIASLQITERPRIRQQHLSPGRDPILG